MTPHSPFSKAGREEAERLRDAPLRDEFAKIALGGMLANPKDGRSIRDEADFDVAARIAYAIADAMMGARKK